MVGGKGKVMNHDGLDKSGPLSVSIFLFVSAHVLSVKRHKTREQGQQPEQLSSLMSLLPFTCLTLCIKTALFAVFSLQTLAACESDSARPAVLI